MSGKEFPVAPIDFESIKVFNAMADSRDLLDKLIFELPCEEFISDFETLWLLSKENFADNALDKYAERHGKKKKKLTVNEKLFDDLKQARKILTEAFPRWTDNLTPEILEEGVQRILDRLVFIRVLEDRGLEQPILKNLINDAKSKDDSSRHIFDRLIKKFRELDDIYNSSIFKEHTCETWEEYDGAIVKVINLLYGGGTQEYDFKIIPADILGGVYESYLSYMAQNPIEADISGTSGKLFKMEGKKELKEKSRKKRKEQGIYYTPKYIVDYIVTNALGPVLDKCKSINDLQKIKILDPACGSGSFLVAAMNFLIKKYEEFGAKPDGYLKIQILQQNIYGVDLDQQAVELARLNLLLNTFDSQTKLPNLGGNIKNGNSLISGTDEELEKYFGKNYRDKNPFNWQEEFSDVFKQGGFDCIIGNPPYVRVDSLDEEDKRFWKNYFITSEGKYDLYYLFIERSIKLLKDSGQLGFIIPNKFCVADSGKKLRIFILESSDIREFFSVSKIDIFKEASNYPVILCLRKGKSADDIIVSFAEHEEEIIKNNFQKNTINKHNLNLRRVFFFAISAIKFRSGN